MNGEREIFYVYKFMKTASEMGITIPLSKVWVCMCGFCNVWVCGYVGFVMCGCVDMWVL